MKFTYCIFTSKHLILLKDIIMESSKLNTREADMQKRENELVLKMSKRMSQLEEQLQEVQKKLTEAVKTIAEKDEQLQNLKAQVIQEGIEKLEQPKSRSLATSNKQYYNPTNEIDDNEEFNQKNKQNSRPRSKKTGVKTTISKDSRKDESFSETKCTSMNNSKNRLNKYSYISSKENLQKQGAGPKELTDLAEEIVMKQTSKHKSRKTGQNLVSDSTSFDKPSERPEKPTANNDESIIMSVGDVPYDGIENNDDSDVSLGEYEDKTSQEMQEEYSRLAKQVSEMEQFLADYGLIWVGDANIRDGDRYRRVAASIGFSPNFDKIIMIISELNDIVSSESHIEVKKNEGKFKKADVLKLTLYADGIQLEDNPFREYSTESVQEFFRDLEDGYYPTELKDIYPDGVIFKVIDKRSATYEEVKTKVNVQPFSGKGRKLGSINEDSGDMTKNIPPYPGPSGRKNIQNQTVSKDEVRKGVKKQGGTKVKTMEIPVNFSKKPDIDTHVRLRKIEHQSLEEENMKSEKDSVERNTVNINNEFSKISAEIEKDTGKKSVELQYSENVIKDSDEQSSIGDTSQNNIKIVEKRSKIGKDVEGSTTEIKDEKEISIPTAENEISTGQIFRDNINITNITYHEAPVTIQQPQPTVIPREDHMQGSHSCECPAAEREYSVGEPPSRYVPSNKHLQNERSRKHLASPTFNEQKEYNDYSTERLPLSGGTPSNISNPLRDGMTEYTQQYDENAKHIIEAIKKRSSQSTENKPQINVNEEFEHFTFLGSKPKMEESTKNTERSEVQLDNSLAGSSIVKETSVTTYENPTDPAKKLSSHTISVTEANDVALEGETEEITGIVTSPTESAENT